MNIKNKILELATNLGEDMSNELKLTCPFASGHLRKSIKPVVTEEGNDVILTIEMPLYAKWVEFGSPPHMPPIEAIREWCIEKGIPEEAAYPIALAIKEQGTRAQPFIRNYIDTKLNSDFKNVLVEVFE